MLAASNKPSDRRPVTSLLSQRIAPVERTKDSSHNPPGLHALDAFFLKDLNRPLFYCGGMMCLSVTSKGELIKKTIKHRYGDDPDDADEIENLIAGVKVRTNAL